MATGSVVDTLKTDEAIFALVIKGEVDPSTQVRDEPIDNHDPVFRCKNCGREEGIAHAGVRAVPRSCRVCGKGTHWELGADGAPKVIDDPDNWELI